MLLSVRVWLYEFNVKYISDLLTYSGWGQETFEWIDKGVKLKAKVLVCIICERTQTVGKLFTRNLFFFFLPCQHLAIPYFLNTSKTSVKNLDTG